MDTFARAAKCLHRADGEEWQLPGLELALEQVHGGKDIVHR